MMDDKSDPLPESTAKGRKWRTWVVALIGTVITCLLIVPMFSSVLIWDGGVRCAVTVEVFEHNSDLPVENAEVQVLGTREERMREVLGGSGSNKWKEAMKRHDADVVGETNDRGTVVLPAECGSGGSVSILGVRKGSYSVNHILEVSHPDYEPVRVTLVSLLGKDRFPLSKKELAVKVWLIPKTSPHSPSDHAPAP